MLLQEETTGPNRAAHRAMTVSELVSLTSFTGKIFVIQASQQNNCTVGLDVYKSHCRQIAERKSLYCFIVRQKGRSRHSARGHDFCVIKDDHVLVTALCCLCYSCQFSLSQHVSQLYSSGRGGGRRGGGARPGGGGREPVGDPEGGGVGGRDGMVIGGRARFGGGV